jgi:hypothetical protein
MLVLGCGVTPRWPAAVVLQASANPLFGDVTLQCVQRTECFVDLSSSASSVGSSHGGSLL